MNVMERLKADHRYILKESERILAHLPGLDANSLPVFIKRLWELISFVEEHEEFEEQNFLLPFSSGVVEVDSLAEVERIRREHSRLFNRLTGLQNSLSSFQALAPEDWNDAARKETRLATEYALGEVRDHIRHEDIGFYFAVAQRFHAESMT